jgi:hypothetical protein
VGAASFLKALSKRVSLDLRPGSPGETLDPSRDRARAALLCRFASWGLALDVHWSEGFVECFGGSVEAGSSSARWDAASGSVW